MNELHSRLGKATVFTKLDLKNGYYLIRMAEAEGWKTAFKSRYGLYEYTVMPFGLCNAPSTFQGMINDVFRDMLDVGVIAYMDDILIYSETIEEYVAIVRKVMDRLRKPGLCVSIKKSTFLAREVEFLGYKISEHGISMRTKKVEEITAWSPPQKVVDVQSFMGFAHSYRRFIKGISKIAKPLTDLTKKGIKWHWTNACQAAFDELKTAFTTRPLLTHFDETCPTKLETDASDWALGPVLSQLCEDERWDTVAFHSRKFAPGEVNYHVHDKEMTAIVPAFSEWEYMLRSVEQITVYTEHKNLEYFNTTMILNRRQHRWAEFLQSFNFKVVYRKGRLNEKADALSRRRDYRPEGGSNSDPYAFFCPHQYVGQERDILRPQVLQSCQGFQLQSAFRTALLKAANQDQSYLDTFKSVLKGAKNVDTSLSIIKDLLCYKNRWCIPKDVALKPIIMEPEHDSGMAGHFRTYKTIGRVRANFYWPKMDEQITEYVRSESCDICEHTKVIRHKKYWLLESIDVPMRPWTSISIDFIVGLLRSEGYTKICVVMDRLTRMAHFIPRKTQEHIKELALIFLKEIWRLHGLPETIISDRDTRFTSKFWMSRMQLSQVKLNVSTTFHPESERQTERVNQKLNGSTRN